MRRAVLERTARRGGGARGRGAEAPGRGRGAVTGRGTVATVGTFDGIHRGHQAVLREVVRRAGVRGGLLLALDPHPPRGVNPRPAPPPLPPADENRGLAPTVGARRGG